MPDGRITQGSETIGQDDDPTRGGVNRNQRDELFQTLDQDSTAGHDAADRSRLDETIDATPSAEMVDEILSICSKFQDRIKVQPLPNLEDYLPLHISGDARADLIEKLLHIELSELRLTNQKIVTPHYLDRFPDHKDAVQSALRSLDAKSVEDTYLVSTPLTTGRSGPSSPSITKPSGVVRYHPIRMHAKGGLGIVYLAKDDEFGRAVALKEIRPQYSKDRSSQDRFVAEAIVTGALEHPGIVPVYGLGRYQDGRPYYAMRFIQGESLQEAIRRFHQAHPQKETRDYFSRSFKSLVRNLIELCSAMYYAHEHGVLHRDIKPDNVMLGKYGETMVVDWGLAKVLATAAPLEGEQKNLSLQALGQDSQNGVVIGTAAFMSPEQAHGKNSDLTTRSDIYSLGATLFVLLTGATAVEGKSSLEAVLNVRNGKIRRIESLAPHAPKALCSICYKAMSLLPKDRYQTAGEMVDDIERWMADDLVLAHKQVEGTIERCGRLVRRYHTWAVAGAIFLLAFTLLAVLAALLIDRARGRELVAKNLAEQSKAEAIDRYRESRTAIDTWLVGSNEVLKFYPGTQSIRKRMLQLATEDYQRLANSPSRDPDLELERARALIRLGDIYGSQQLYLDARSNYQAAVTALNAISAPVSIIPSRDAERANTMTRTGISYFQEDQLKEAQAQFDAAIDSLESLVASHPEHKMSANYLASAWINAGELQLQQSNYPLAISSLQSGLDCYTTLDSMASPELTSEINHELFGDQQRRDCLMGAARARELLSRALQATGKYVESDQALSLAIAMLQEQLISHPDDPELNDAIASALVSRGELFRIRGLHTELEQSLITAIEHYQALCLAMPDVPRYAEQLALALTNLGIATQDHGRSREAMSILDKAQQQWKPLLELYGEIPRFHKQTAACEDALAQVVLDASDQSEIAMQHAAAAVQTYQQLAELFSDQPEYEHRLAVARSHAAIIQMRLGNIDNSQLLFESARMGLRQLIAIDPTAVGYRHALAHVLNQEGRMQYAAAKQTEGRASFSESIELWTELAEAGSAASANDLALLYLVCPCLELRSRELALRFSELAASIAPQNSRFKSLRAISLSMTGDALGAKKLMDEILAEQREWIGCDFFALSIISRSTDDAKADDWLVQGDLWMEANQPGNSTLRDIRELVLTSR